MLAFSREKCLMDPSEIDSRLIPSEKERPRFPKFNEKFYNSLHFLWIQGRTCN